MEYLHLIMDETIRDSVRRIAQNDPSLFWNQELLFFDANTSLALGHALIGNSHLQHLRLPNLVLTEEAAHALAEGMAQSKIESLLLCDSRPPSHESSIGDIFYRGIQASTTIQKLGLWQSQSNDPGNAWRDALLGVSSIEIKIPDGHGYIQAFSEVLSRATLLKELTLNLKKLEPADMTILAHGLCQNSSITLLRFVKLACQDAPLLFAQELSPNSAITKLSVVDGLNDDGCIELLLNHWLPNCLLRHLDLSHNTYGPTGAQRVIQALAAHPTIVELNLNQNNNIGYAGLRMIGNELANLHHLTHLHIYSCFTWYDDLEADSEEAEARTTACQQSGQALVAGIKHNFSITDLMVFDNGFPQSVEDEIQFYCALNSMGRRLLFDNDGHGLSPSVWCHIFNKCCQRQPDFGTSLSTRLVYFFLKEQPTLVQRYPC